MKCRESSETRFGEVWRVLGTPKAKNSLGFFGEKIVFETSNGRLPPEDGSDRHETSGKRVSGDPRHFIFRRHKHFLRPKFLLQNIFRQRSETFFSKVPVLE